ncbi:MAG: hypothetical protein MJA82_15145 [Clostridia bacterium]|nr:hypothetical protein [Clostridia bacterium]
MYIKITGHLIDILGDGARGNIEEVFGIKLSSEYQFEKISLGEITNMSKVQNTIINDSRVTILETKELFNTEIDKCYVEKYFLLDSTQLQVDLMLSGNPSIPNYDAAKPLSSPENLKALYDANMGGIKKSEKPPYIV